MKILIFALTLLVLSSAQAILSLPVEENYQSGRILCETNYKEIISREKGFFVAVPVDYANPEKGTTEVYAYFSPAFDPKKEILVYFTGGPGQPAHWGLFGQEMPYNILIIEQRGIGCSRPPKLKQFLDPQFYSSENVARDAEVIRRHLKIAKWSVYGISYGTIPATIHGSLFPGSTRAVILEGVVFSGEISIWEGPHRRKILQRLLNTLPSSLQQKLDDVSVKYGVPAEWLSVFARGQLMFNSGGKALHSQLLKLANDGAYESFVREMKDLFNIPNQEVHPLFMPNEIPYYMISCQELSMASDRLRMMDVLVQGQLVSVLDKRSPTICKELKAGVKKTYQATQYPIKIPVTYFQGGDDSATPAPQAIFHYKQVARAKKQLMLLTHGGHNPNLQLLMEDNGLQLKLFGFAVRGEQIPSALIQEFNLSGNLSWAFTAK